MKKNYESMLIERARSAARRAYCPYSRFRVGAALLTSDGSVFSGCNVENASYGLTICAERSAISAAVSAGHRKFRAIAVVASGSKPPVPCGACLQVLAEFCRPSTQVLLSTMNNRRPAVRRLLRHLMPFVFKR